MALNEHGELYSWGSGGITGTGDMNNKTFPIKLEFFNKTKV
jgi:hypothetical protein